MNHFEGFLKDCMGLKDFAHVRLVPRIDEHGKVRFYAHPHGINGDTFDGEVSGKHVRAIESGEPAEEPVDDAPDEEPVDEDAPDEDHDED